MSKLHRGNIFTRFTSSVSAAIGRPWVFVIALVILIAWGVAGPFSHFSDTWQLLINTGTTIITFLMVFIIQNTQNRDNMAMNIKLVAIMKKMRITGEDLIQAEEESDKKLEAEKRAIERPTSQRHKHSERR